MKFTLSQIAQICSARYYGADVSVSSVITDSRTAKSVEGALFVAIRGVNHDAHDYIDDMVARGVKGFIAEKEIALPEGCGVVVVEDSLAALQSLAAHYRAQFKGSVVGITGSNGKTMVKEWIAASVLSTVKLYRSPRSYNSQLGVALSLLMIPEDADIAVIEAGISHPGEMQSLKRMIAPQTVIFTSLGDAHQANFKSIEQKLREKLILAADAENIIYSSDCKLLADTLQTEFADKKLIDSALITAPKMADEISTRNARTVAAFCALYNLPQADFSALQPVAMRLEVKPAIGGGLIIDDSYSCDIDSFSIAMDYLTTVADARRKVVVLSDILQSGLEDEKLYAVVADIVRRAGVSLFIGIGNRIAAQAELFADNSLFFATTEQLLENISKIDITDSAILIKGNRLSRTERISHRLELKSHTTVLEVNLRAMERNINYFRSQMPSSTRLVAMVKASSYGAGDREVAQMLAKQGVDYLAVAFADEGVELREAGVNMPIVVLNADDQSFDTMVAYHLEPEIYSFESLDSFASAARGENGYPIHIKFDTGMHRLGFGEGDIQMLLERLARYSATIRVASIFTHLSVADDTLQDEFTKGQIELFDRVSSSVMDALGYKVLRHAAASAAILRFPEAHFDMCRLGLGMYGYGYEHNDNLEPVSTLRTRIVQIRELDADQTVGYGRAGVLARRSRIA
ncbi:MAG: alanine racemase, partial [Alistipes sp.]|nr:alanine racemase [Alistipes sp.]